MPESPEPDRPFHGIMWGCLLSLPLWIFLGVLAWILSR